MPWYIFYQYYFLDGNVTVVFLLLVIPDFVSAISFYEDNWPSTLGSSSSYTGNWEPVLCVWINHTKDYTYNTHYDFQIYLLIYYLVDEISWFWLMFYRLLLLLKLENTAKTEKAMEIHWSLIHGELLLLDFQVKIYKLITGSDIRCF